MKNSVSMLAALVFLTATGTALAGGKWLKNESANFRVEIPPSNWAEAHRGEIIVAETVDRSMIVEIIGHPNQEMTLEAASFDTGKAVRALGQSLDEVKLSGIVKEVQHNGMACVEYAGAAKNRAHSAVDFAAITCKSGDRKGVTAVMFATPTGWERHKPGARLIWTTLKPIRPITR
jgi:hypothetical protein